jgi:mannose-6-phosphate isomerase-like protein (cupin superfamily)
MAACRGATSVPSRCSPTPGVGQRAPPLVGHAGDHHTQGDRSPAAAGDRPAVPQPPASHPIERRSDVHSPDGLSAAGQPPGQCGRPVVPRPADLDPGRDRAERRLGGRRRTPDPGGRPVPWHVHHAQDESLYVLEGSITMLVGDDHWTLGPGDYALGPREVPHGLRVEGEMPARCCSSAHPGRAMTGHIDLASARSFYPRKGAGP